MPKIIFINGQWKLAERVPFGLGENLGPTEPKNLIGQVELLTEQ